MNIKKAIKDFDKAIEIDPNFIKAYNNRAIIKNKLGLKEGAAEDFKRIDKLEEVQEKLENINLSKYQEIFKVLHEEEKESYKNWLQSSKISILIIFTVPVLIIISIIIIECKITGHNIFEKFIDSYIIFPFLIFLISIGYIVIRQTTNSKKMERFYRHKVAMVDFLEEAKKIEKDEELKNKIIEKTLSALTVEPIESKTENNNSIRFPNLND